MSTMTYTPKERQQLMPLFDGKFVENKPIPFPDIHMSKAYSNLFYWAHLVALETGEFPLHPHKGFEIMTFVFKGSLEHYDTATKVWTPLSAGGVQSIQAGSGVKHAERITKGSELFQIWFDPDFSRTLKESAQYKDYPEEHFHATREKGIELIEYVGRQGVVDSITKGLTVKEMRFDEGAYHISIDSTATYSLYLLDGRMRVNTQVMEKDSFLTLKDEQLLSIEVYEYADLFMIESPSVIDYLRFIDRGVGINALDA